MDRIISNHKLLPQILTLGFMVPPRVMSERIEGDEFRRAEDELQNTLSALVRVASTVPCSATGRLVWGQVRQTHIQTDGQTDAYRYTNSICNRKALPKYLCDWCTASQPASQAAQVSKRDEALLSCAASCEHASVRPRERFRRTQLGRHDSLPLAQMARREHPARHAQGI